MKHFLVLGVLSVLSLNAWSWGALGHKTSANIAWAYLDKDTQSKVTEMLGGSTIADAAVWPDAARGNAEWKFSIWYHFEKAPDNYTYLDNLKRQDDRTHKLGGLVEALFAAEDIIKNPTSTPEEKAIALKFVIHCVGDIHQPLHTGRVEDNSGNKIPKTWQGLDTNLHSIWDSQMIYFGHKDLFVDAAVDQSQAYANLLLTKYKDFKPTPDLFVKYDDWMHESMVPRKDAYDFKDENEQQYTNRFLDVVDMRLYLAGLRIAYVVKRLVYQEASNQPLALLRKAIVDIVGDFNQFVTLRPRALTQPPNPPTDPPQPVISW